ncbi:MAG: methionine--tRNA ligase [Puniceicoccales bacterium]|nr:methionine--tRNA ligase [Puniceicoccales bacterium]
MKHFYLTTAIDYANGKPHMGHAYEKILADVIARYQRLCGQKVHFLTGLDEHGQKVQQTAEKEGITPQQLCDHVILDFKNMCDLLHISYNDYIRTTERRHRAVVRDVLQKLFEKGDIYLSEYRGFYCPRLEQFLQKKDKVKGRWPEELGEIIEISESNYFFRLSSYRPWLISYIEEHPNFIFPRFRARQVLEFLKTEVNDLCISRPQERLAWGIPLPFDERYVTYVWFDALLNYVSAIGYGEERFEDYWPANFHIIGKDILTPAHAVYWPCMLKAMGLEMPKTLLVHGWWLASGEKMSKSVGNVIRPLDYVRHYGADAFRYFVMREMMIGQDCDFSHERFVARYNGDLGNDLGNLVSRLLHMLQRYSHRIIPQMELRETEERVLQQQWQDISQKVSKFYRELAIPMALESLWEMVRSLNRFAEIRAPWQLAKSSDGRDKKKLETTLAIMAEGLRLVATALQPVMPKVSQFICYALGVSLAEDSDLSQDLVWSHRLVGHRVEGPMVLFPRVKM